MGTQSLGDNNLWSGAARAGSQRARLRLRGVACFRRLRPFRREDRPANRLGAGTGSGNGWRLLAPPRRPYWRPGGGAAQYGAEVLGCLFPDRAKRRRGPRPRLPSRGSWRPRSAAAEPQGTGGRRAGGSGRDRRDPGGGRGAAAGPRTRAEIGGAGWTGSARGWAPCGPPASPGRGRCPPLRGAVVASPLRCSPASRARP